MLLLTLMLAARLGAAAPETTLSLYAGLSTEMHALNFSTYYPSYCFTLGNTPLTILTDGENVKAVESIREPVVTRTADGWEISFKEPVKPTAMPPQTMTLAAPMSISPMPALAPKPAATASTSRP